MNRRDYDVVAKVIFAELALNPKERHLAIFDTARHLARDFKFHNANFNEDKFLTACGFENYKVPEEVTQ